MTMQPTQQPEPQDRRELCSDDVCENSPEAPYNRSAHPLGNDANQRPATSYDEEIEKQKQYYKGGVKP